MSGAVAGSATARRGSSVEQGEAHVLQAGRHDTKGVIRQVLEPNLYAPVRLVGQARIDLSYTAIRAVLVL